MSTEGRRWFNLITILLSSLIALTFGSLMGLLGSMVRWHLLAARPGHSLADVDRILGMPQPTGALRLIWSHTIRSRRWTSTTHTALLYLFWTIVGTLSIAALGLTFDLDEDAGVEFPVLITDWSSANFTSTQADQFVGTYDDYPSIVFLDAWAMQKYAALGLLSLNVSTRPPEEWWQDDVASVATNISGQGLDSSIEGNTVTYTYHLKEYQGAERYASTDKVVQSSSSCLGRVVINGGIYEQGERITMPERVGETSPDFLRVLYYFLDYDDRAESFEEIWQSVLWATIIHWDQGWQWNTSTCLTTYIYHRIFLTSNLRLDQERNATFFECHTCLSGVNSDVLRNLPAENSSYVNQLLLQLGVMSEFYTGLDGLSETTALHYHPYSIFGHLNFLEGVASIAEADRGYVSGLTPEMTPESEHLVAHHTARLPMLVLLGAEMKLPKVAKEEGATPRPYVTIALQIRWDRALGVLWAIFSGEILTVIVVVAVCRRTPIPNRNQLTSAWLLKSVSMHLTSEGSSPGETAVRLRYGARLGSDGIYELGLWRVDEEGNGVEDGFPQGQYRYTKEWAAHVDAGLRWRWLRRWLH